MELKDLYKISKSGLEGAMNTELLDFRLEEVEYLEKEKYWMVVVSYLVQNINKPETPPLLNMAREILPYERIFKSVKIRDSDSRILGFSMYDGT